LANKNSRAAQGESGLSSLHNGDAGRGDRVDDVRSAETQAPAAAEASWDPYQVWLTRVKQPREQSVRMRRQGRTASEQPSSTDLSETARLRTLTMAR